MPGLPSGQVKSLGFVRSALMLLACISVVALALTPVALRNSGSGGLAGLAVAAAICLAAGLAAEGFSTLLVSIGQTLAAPMVGMGIRMVPPLFLCLALGASGQSGRAHLPFIFYLLAFYFTTLVMESWLAIKRVADTRSSLAQGSH